MNIAKMYRSEETEQIELMKWASLNEDQYPELKWMFHVPNGGSRNKREAVALKQMGVKAGVSDLILLVPKGMYSGLIIEMKYGSNTLSESQREFLSTQMKNNYCCVVCYSAAYAKEIIKAYLKLKWSEEIIPEFFEEGVYTIHKLWRIPVMKRENINKKGK